MDAESFYELIRSRRSVRSYQERQVPEEVVQRILSAGCRAPSAHNSQPWRFAVVSKGKWRSEWVEAMARRLRMDLVADGHSVEEIERQVRSRKSKLLRAPIAIILCLTMEDMEEYLDDRRNQAERVMGTQSVALAGGTMLLAAQTEGLGACWMCAPLFASQETKEALDLPEAWAPQGVLLLGYPSGVPPSKERFAVDQVTFWR